MLTVLNLAFTFLATRPHISPRTGVIKMLEPFDLVRSRGPFEQLSYNAFSNLIKDVDTAAIIEDKNVAVLHDKLDHITLYKYIPQNANDVIDSLVKNHVDFQVFDLSNQGIQVPFLVQVIGLIIVFNVISFFLQRNGMGTPPGFMNRMNNVDMNLEVNTTFADVAGIPEAKEELYEIVDFLKNPGMYAQAGAKIPRGVLLEGDPGTGKTLLARAVAGEANVNFISASGSQFVEMFVGVGAQRVRSLFEKAKENAPCVIFIDEIDAIGGKRGYGFNSGGNDEREQTLNQILTNMDGFEKTEGIIVLAATNRIDTLDPALLRSGRFDRKVKVTLPNKPEREEIARIHFRNKNANFSYTKLADLTSGFSGADIENLANEAAILSIRNNETVISDTLILQSFEKCTIGLPKKEDTRSLTVKRLVALHEAGHALVIKTFPEYFNLQKVTMNANTAGAGGYTLFTPKDFYNEYPTKGFYMARIIAALGGRAAEMLHSDVRLSGSLDIEYSHVTTGASNDLMQATSIANKYIDLFESYVVDETYSQNWQYRREKRVKEIIDDCLEKATNILRYSHIDLLILRNQLLANNTVSF
jgi:cell division protease FtsH